MNDRFFINMLLIAPLLVALCFVPGCKGDEFEEGMTVSVPKHGIERGTVVAYEHFNNEESPCTGESGWWVRVSFVTDGNPPSRAERLHGNQYELWVRDDDVSLSYGPGEEYVESYDPEDALVCNIVPDDSDIDPSTVHVSDASGLSGLVSQEIGRMSGSQGNGFAQTAEVIHVLHNSIISANGNGEREIVYNIALRINGEEVIILSRNQELAEAFQDKRSVDLTVNENIAQFVETE